jgi:hypothetical protein
MNHVKMKTYPQGIRMILIADGEPVAPIRVRHEVNIRNLIKLEQRLENMAKVVESLNLRGATKADVLDDLGHEHH